MVISVQEMGQRAKNVTSQVAMLSLKKRNALRSWKKMRI